MKVRSTIYLSSLLMVSLISTMVVFLFIFSWKIHEETKTEATVDKVVKGIMELVLVADDYMAYPYERKSRQWNTQHEKLEKLVRAAPEKDTYKGLSSRLHLLSSLFEKLRMEMAKDPKSVVIERVMGRMRWVSHDLITHGYAIMDEKNQRTASLQRKSNILLFSISILLVAVSILTSLIIIKSTVLPLKRLTEDAERIREGNLELIPNEIEHKEPKNNEFRTLSRAFYAMAARLAKTISDQKKIEKDLRNRNEYIQAILDSMPIGFALHTIDDGVNRYVNDKFEEIYGWPQEGMATVDLFFQNVFPDPVYREEFMARVLADMESGDPDRMVWTDMPITTKSGEKRFATAFNIPLIHQNLMISTVQDTTLRKKAEEEVKRNQEHLEELVKKRTRALAATNAELKEFAYIVSHDLKAPLRAVSQLSYWIREDHGDKLGDEGKEQISLLITRVKRMDGLIDGILQYSRIGRTREKKEKVNLHTLVLEVIGSLSSPEQMQISILNPLPAITGDRTQMEQVFQNLISNAIKFMDKTDGIIQIKCVDDESSWQFSVKDNGPGIDPRYHDRIFKIFQTLSSRDERESTGIGLTLVKKIVELYGGRVWVESQPGAGSTFFFTLPKV